MAIQMKPIHDPVSKHDVIGDHVTVQEISSVYHKLNGRTVTQTGSLSQVQNLSEQD